MKPFLKVMKALSDPSRVRVVKMLEHRELCACEIQELLGLAQSTVSRHMKALEEAGLVASRKQGVWLNYRLAGAEQPYAAKLLSLLAGWHNDDPGVQRMLERLDEVDRRELCSRRQDS